MSLTDLARQSANLIRAGQGSRFLDPKEPLPGLGGFASPEEEEDTGEESRSRPKYSTAETLDYYLVRDALIANIWGGQPRGQTSVINDFINSWVDTRLENGQYAAFPTADQLLTDPDFQNGAWATRFRAAGAPPAFVYTDDSGDQFWVTTVGKQPGIFPLQVTRDQMDTTGIRPGATGVDPTRPDIGGARLDREDVAAAATAEVGKRPDTQEPIMAVPEDTEVPVRGGRQDVPGRPPQSAVQGITTNDVDADRRLANRALAQAAQGAPTFNSSELGNLLSKGGGGGGGGGGRQPLAFDQEAMEEAARDQWRSWLFEDPDPDALGKMVRQYQSEAQSFWAAKGGRLDFNVFVRERLREQPRYSSVFKWRPPDMGEDEFLGQFRQIEGFGLRADTSREETLRSVMSGGSGADQTVRVSRTREASNLAGAGRRFANTVMSLGRLG